MSELEPMVVEHEVDWLDGSKVDDFHLCPQRYAYRHERHLLAKASGLEAFLTAAQFGTAIHHSLASIYDGTWNQKATCPCPAMGCEFCRGNLVPRCVALFLLHWPQDPPEKEDSRYQNPRTRVNGLQILNEYIKLYIATRKDSFQVVGTELAFSMPFLDDKGEVLFLYKGRVDLIFLEDGKFKSMDHKTTYAYNMFWDSGWRLNHAQTGYIKSIHEFTGDCSESEINGIRVTSKISEDSFRRFTTNRTPYDFERWEREVRVVYSLIQEYRKANFWPRHSPYACSAYNHMCPYYQLCTASPENVEEIIANNYDVVEWDPFKEA